MPGSLALPHDGQSCSSGAAQPPQKRRPSLFSVPQFAQTISAEPNFAAQPLDAGVDLVADAAAAAGALLSRL